MGEWKRVRLEDACEGIFDCPHSTAPDEGSGYPLIRTPNVGRGRLMLENVHRVSKAVYDKRNARAIPSPGDLIFAREAPAGNVACIQPDQWVCLGQRTVLIRPQKELLDSNYLAYYLLSPKLQASFGVLANGATVSHINIPDIRNLEVEFPDLPTQRRIAAVLGALDDKIEVNRKICENLEAQAQALFKAWFVDFEPFGGKRPEGWKEIPLFAIADFYGGYSYKGAELQESDCAMVTIKNFDRGGGFKLNGFKEIVPSSKLKHSHEVDLFDTLVAHTDLTQNAEVIGNAEMLLSKAGYKKIIMSMDLVKVGPKHGISRFLLGALLKNGVFKSHCLRYVNGTTVLHLSKMALTDYTLDFPDDPSVLDSIAQTFERIYRKIAVLIDESRALAAMRDALLPKLMSGELDVEKVEVADACASHTGQGKGER